MTRIQKIEILDLGRLGYQQALRRQLDLVEARIKGSAPDSLILIEHPSVVTLGRSGSQNDLCVSEAALQQRGVELYKVDRGGQATFHEPGQLVAYPIVKLAANGLHRYLKKLLEVVGAVVRTYGLTPVFKNGRPGVWIKGGKIASIGIAVKKWVAYHGIALNVNNNLDGFNWIVPCGHPGERITSLKAQLGYPIDLSEVKKHFTQQFWRSFGYAPKNGNVGAANKHPAWLIRPAPIGAAIHQMEKRLDHLHLATVCQSARCPNLGECFNRGTATFMILGTRCTRNCRFCAIGRGTPQIVDLEEPERIARAAKSLGLKHVVVTSVTRDDLADGGATQFSQTIEHVRNCCEHAKIEVLIPDFGGSISALQAVCDARPDVLNHNVETVERLYPNVRPGAHYRRSLGILEYAARQRLPVKSGLMLGLGESSKEIKQILADLKRAGCRYLTLGQYLAPSSQHHPVTRFVPPEEFDDWSACALRMGFKDVAAGPLVRSSYRADEMMDN